MKKSKFFAAALAATMFVTAACGLVACDKDPGEITPGTKPSESQGTEYTVTFSGTNVSKITSGGKLSGTMPTATAPSGQELKGWAKSATATTPDITTSNYTSYKFSGTDTTVTLYPLFGPQQSNNQSEYTITLDATTNGGSCSTPTVTTVDKKVPNLPNATKGTDTFEGWFTAPTGGKQINAGDTADGTVTTIYAQFTPSGGGGETDYSTDGVYIGTQCYALSLNGEASRTEYWFGGSKYTFAVGDTMSIYMDGVKISAYLEPSSEGVDKSVTDEEISEFSVTLEGEFAVYLHRNDNDWSVEFAGPTNFGGENQLPGGTPFILKGSDNNSITIYIRDESGKDVTNLGNYKVWAWNDNGNFWDKWDNRPTISATVNTTTALGTGCNVIITWGGSQTGNFNGLKAGKIYVITIAAGGGTIAEVNV